MIKTKKSDFMTKLHELLPNKSAMAENPAVVICDGMAIVQILPVHSEQEIFTDIAVKFQVYTLSKARDISPTLSKFILFSTSLVQIV